MLLSPLHYLNPNGNHVWEAFKTILNNHVIIIWAMFIFTQFLKPREFKIHLFVIYDHLMEYIMKVDIVF
jgi:hypothetical protein